MSANGAVRSRENRFLGEKSAFFDKKTDFLRFKSCKKANYCVQYP